MRGADEGAIERRWLARAGLEPDDFEFFVTKYEKDIFRYLAVLLQDRDLAADLTQTTFLSAFENASRFRFRGLTMRGWLFRIAYNAACREAGQRQRRRHREVAADVDGPAEGPDPEEGLGGREIAAVLHEELLELRDAYRHVIVLHYWERLGVTEIALVMKVKRNTVKSWLGRAREELAERLHRRGVRIENRRGAPVVELDPAAEIVPLLRGMAGAADV
ncbi:MAG: sigma-70 family RNA polymerase sigma factor [Candidatus Krumholzibacteriia bacterium]